MNADQWIEIVEWVGDRFPNDPWNADTATAYFYDLEQFDVSDVWSGVFYLYEEGQSFAPNGSQMLHATRKLRRRSAFTELLEPRALPISSSGIWSVWAEKRFGEKLTAIEMIERLHRESTKCNSKSCPFHAKESVGQSQEEQ